MSRILLFDIEIINRCFGDAWQTMSADPTHSTICSFGWKEQTEKKAHCIGLDKWKENFKKDAYNEENLVREAHKILTDCDGLIAHYGDKFDVKYMRTKFMIYGLDHQILDVPTRDTCLIARRKLKMHSNRLNALLEVFGFEQKDKMHMNDWFKVIQGNMASMRKMNKYCANDVNCLHELYKKIHHLFPQSRWPHEGISLNNTRDACPECGSLKVQKRGIVVKQVGKYQRYQCMDCGKWYQDTRMMR